MKKGLDYFSMPCMADERIELIEAELGLEAFGVIVKLYGRIYGQNGYYCNWDSDCALLFARRLCVDEVFVQSVVSAAIKRGIFDRNMLDTFGILTSAEIQYFFFNAAKRRKDLEIEDKYLCVDRAAVPSCVRIVKASGEAEEAHEACSYGTIGKASDVIEGTAKSSGSYVNKIAKGNVRVDTQNGEKAEENDSVTVKDERENVPGKGFDSDTPLNAKKPYGHYGNVMLTNKERAELDKLIPNAEDYVDRFSQKLRDRGYTYSNHFKAILDWWKIDSRLPVTGAVIACGGIEREKAVSKASSFDTNDFFEAAIKKVTHKAQTDAV